MGGSIDPDIANIYSLEDLKSAANNSAIKKVNLKADITDINEVITFNNSVTFDGEGFKLGFATTGQNLVFLKPSTVSNLIVEANGTDKWTSTYAVQVYNGKGYKINDCSFSGGNAGLLVNSATATVNNIDVSGNTFGGIEVSKGTAVKYGSTLTVSGTITNSSESYGKPTIWIDGKDDGNTVTATGLFSSDAVKDNQIQYYINETNMSE